MRDLVLALAFACSVSGLITGCATTDTVRNAPITQGLSQDFAAPYEAVKAAAVEAVQRLNVNVQGSDETPQRFQIRFSKPISAFSWGEVGVVNVLAVDARTTRVYVNTEKRDQIQLTGTSERRFAETIFINITQSLPRVQP